MRKVLARAVCDILLGRKIAANSVPVKHPGQIALEGRVGEELIVKGTEDGKSKKYRDTLAYPANANFFYLGTAFGYYVVDWDLTKDAKVAKEWGAYAQRMFRTHSIELPDGTEIYRDDSVPYEKSS